MPRIRGPSVLKFFSFVLGIAVAGAIALMLLQEAAACESLDQVITFSAATAGPTNDALPKIDAGNDYVVPTYTELGSATVLDKKAHLMCDGDSGDRDDMIALIRLAEGGAASQHRPRPEHYARASQHLSTFDAAMLYDEVEDFTGHIATRHPMLV